MTLENFYNPQRWNQYAYVNNSPLAAVDPNGADGQGKGGDKVISVFLDVSSKDLGRTVTTVNGQVTSDVANISDWQGTKGGAPAGYKVDVFGNSDVSGESGHLANSGDYESALKNSEVVIYVGHGEADPQTSGPGTDAAPFRQGAITPGLENGGDRATMMNYGWDGKWIGGQPLQSKPDVSAKVVVSFTCDASGPGGSYYNFTGKGQIMVTMNSGRNGVTDASTQERAANAFVKAYMNAKGDYVAKTEAGVAAANKVLRKSKHKDDAGDSVNAERVN